MNVYLVRVTWVDLTGTTQERVFNAPEGKAIGELISTLNTEIKPNLGGNAEIKLENAGELRGVPA